MISREDIFMIGSSSRNVGKTEFACRAIKKLAVLGDVMGIKVTVVDSALANDHAGQHSVVDFPGEYSIHEECDTTSGKDTSRMLASGAAKVWWIRTKCTGIKKALNEVLLQIPEGVPIVCESLNARTIFKPGMFVIIQDKDVVSAKDTLKKVVDFADRIVTFSNLAWDFQPEQLSYCAGMWKMGI